MKATLMILPILLATAVQSSAAVAADPATPADVTTDQSATADEKDKDKDKAKGTLLHPKVEKPIADTYEPLGSHSYDRAQELSKPVDEAMELKRQAKENKQAKKAEKQAGTETEQSTPAPGTEAERRALEGKIQDGTQPPAAKPASPKVEADKDSLQIHDSR